jgi:hypothetical protein
VKLWLALGLVVGSLSCFGAAHAGGRIPYGGVIRVSLTPEEVPTWTDSVSDCVLFQQKAGLGGGVTPELAQDAGRWQGNTLTLTIVPGARFHNGDVIKAQHVVASLRRAGREASPIRAGLAQLMPRAVGELVVDLRVPADVSASTVRRLLAHPAAAIRHQGSRCGAFSPVGAIGTEARFEAHGGHPRGRPWLDGVTLSRVATRDRAVQALVFKGADVTATASSRNTAISDASPRGWSTVFAVPGDRWRGSSGRQFRRRVAWLTRKTRFASHLDAPFERAASLFPSDYDASIRQGPVRAEPLELDQLIVAYPAARADLKELADVLRDTLRVDYEGTPRVLPVEGLTLEGAMRGAHPWTIAVVTLDWTAMDATQAVLELAHQASLPAPDALKVLREGHAAWLKARHSEQALIPMVHLRLPAFHRRTWRLANGAGRAGGLAWSWRQP